MFAYIVFMLKFDIWIIRLNGVINDAILRLWKFIIDETGHLL